MTEEEKQQIIDEVLAAIATNAKTIKQLTPVVTLGGDDHFEVSGGKRISYTKLAELIAAMSTEEQQSLIAMIEKRSLKSVEITTTATAATLKIESYEKTITCSVPLASTSNPGLVTPEEKLKISSAYSTANAANEIAQAARTAAANAQTSADNAQGTADEAKEMAQGIEDSKGQAEGIAPLDDAAKVPSENLPFGTVFSVLKFNGFVSGVTLESSSAPFPLANARIWFDTAKGTFVFSPKVGEVKYYNNCEGADVYGEDSMNGKIPYAEKLYCDTTNAASYMYNGSTLVVVANYLAIGEGEKQAASGALLKSTIAELGKVTFLNATKAFGLTEPKEIADIAAIIAQHTEYMSAGLVVTFLASSGWESWQWNGGAVTTMTNWRKFGGGSSIGNAFNATAERINRNEPRIIPGGTTYFDTLDTALSYAYDKGVATVGMQVTFALAEGSWKNYQYVGTVTEPKSEFCNPEKWVDMAGLNSGSEPLININLLCADTGQALSGDCYTLALAISALKVKHQQSGIDYIKKGLIITYKTAPNTWETKQLVGEAADFEQLELWHDFGNGGGGSQVVISDIPEEGGTDAFSTGGAYSRLPADIDSILDEDTGDTEYFMVNAKGEKIGQTSIIVPQGGGGGGGGATNLNITFEENPLYKAFGGDIKVRASIRSVTKDGELITTNVIKTLSILDATTGVELYTSQVNQQSSASQYDYSFEIDFTPYMTAAGSKDFQVKAVDDEGNAKRKSITIVAIDATVQVKGIQTLNYTTQTSLVVGSTSSKDIPLYKFPGATKRAPIECTIEMLWEGEWREFQKVTVEDSYTKGVSVNPTNVFGGGEAMTHGAYPLRVQGKDVNSGVVGNKVYTGIMCVGASYSAPILVMRYNDAGDGKIKLYETLSLEVAAYTPNQTQTQVKVYADNQILTTVTCYVSAPATVTKQVQGYATDGSQSITVYATAQVGSVVAETNQITIQVFGSAIDAAIKEGAVFGYEFAGRSNDEPTHVITSAGITMEVNGCNWSSNGFIDYLGEKCLAIKENVTANIPYMPYSSTAAKSAGAVIQFAFATNNIKDADALLCECYDPTQGVGFYVKGNVAGIYCATGNHQREERKFKCGEKITMAVVVEPDSIRRLSASDQVEYSNIKLYLNGEEAACIGYVSDSDAIIQRKTISFNGTYGDFHLYYLMAYASYYEWKQAFDNYLVKLTDTTAMMDEYDFNQVLDEMHEPSLASIKQKGYPHYVVVAPQSVFDTFDGDTNTSTKFSCTLYYFNPQYPCLNFKATNVQWRRQGTTSAKRPIKNDRFYLNKPVNKANPTVITLLNPDPSTQLGQEAIGLAAINYIRVKPDSIPVQIITVKVDYSDSSNANDCGVCDMMNDTYRASGNLFMTPAQRNFDGTFSKGDVSLTGLKMNHSTRNHPIAAFRATNDGMTDAWFHAKANWKEDKGEQVALGFQNTPGYNKGCRNYGDFIEIFGTKDETLDQIEARFRTMEGLDTTKLYLLSLYAGQNYRFMRNVGGTWMAATGSMKQVGGKWQVTGDVLNPVSGYELLTYNAMCWWRGVDSVETMMQMQEAKSSWVSKLVDAGSVSATTFPAWTQYFECMIDDDQLQIDLAYGRKCPYDLYMMLKFCNDCDFRNVAESVWKPKWKAELHNYASVRSLYTYTAFTDYLAATDQRAKNMQPMWFLEDGFSVTNGVYSSEFARKMYLNKVYDCDTCNGKDNDGGCTVDAECDPNKPTSETYVNPYAGWDSILFNNVDKCPIVMDDNGTEIGLLDVIKSVRAASTTNEEGVNYVPFSPDGATYHFLKKRLQYWPKVISSYDGERKYVESVVRSDAVYFYALQGLGLTALPQFIQQRWNYRDGYYQCGGFVASAHSISGRIGAAGTTEGITIKAAKTGYFGCGYESEGRVTEIVYLEAGQTHRFTQFDHNPGSLFWLYQADRISEIDLSEISLDDNFQFAKMSLVEVLKIGSETHVDVPVSTYTPLTSMLLGNLPFLREVDVRNTTVAIVNAGQCPRLEKMQAEGSRLTTCTVAETSPINVLTMPATMTSLQFNNLPNLAYPGGLAIAGLGSVTRLFVNGCPNIDTTKLLADCCSANATISFVRLTGLNANESVAPLQKLKADGATGLDQSGAAYEETGQCSGLVGRWISKSYIDDATISQLDAYFPQCNVYNSQFQLIKLDDTISDPADKMSNYDNSTGHDFGNDYAQSGHLLKIEQDTHAYKCTYDEQQHALIGTQLSDEDFNYLRTGETVDLYDLAGEGYDFFWHMAHCWYKGVNDYKNQCKWYIWSSTDSEPLPSYTKISRAPIGGMLRSETSGVYVANAVIGQPIGEDVIGPASSCNVYETEVSGMRQVRWPGLNNATLGALFLDKDGKVVSTFVMAVSDSMFDFTQGDYVFCDVPAGAVKFIFTAYKNLDGLECIATDSSSVEAVEPDWIEHKAATASNPTCAEDSLIGIYPITVDTLRNARSVSKNGSARAGDNTSTTSTAWTYDSAGRITNTSAPSTLHYTFKDFQNLVQLRGAGYQMIDYEQSKDAGNLWYCCRGNLNEQSVVSNGAQAAINRHDAIGMSDSTSLGNAVNSIMGLKAFVGCWSEWLDNIALNCTTYEQFLVRKGTEYSEFPIDGLCRIYDPIAKTERLLGYDTRDGSTSKNMARAVHGRHMDSVARRCESDTSKFVTNFCCGSNAYAATRSRVVGRSGYSSSAYSGLAYSGANNGSSNSNTVVSSRLAFRGKFVIAG